VKTLSKLVLPQAPSPIITSFLYRSIRLASADHTNQAVSGHETSSSISRNGIATEVWAYWIAWYLWAWGDITRRIEKEVAARTSASHCRPVAGPWLHSGTSNCVLRRRNGMRRSRWWPGFGREGVRPARLSRRADHDRDTGADRGKGNV